MHLLEDIRVEDGCHDKADDVPVLTEDRMEGAPLCSVGAVAGRDVGLASF